MSAAAAFLPGLVALLGTIAAVDLAVAYLTATPRDTDPSRD